MLFNVTLLYIIKYYFHFIINIIIKNIINKQNKKIKIFISLQMFKNYEERKKNIYVHKFHI